MHATKAMAHIIGANHQCSAKNKQRISRTNPAIVQTELTIPIIGTTRGLAGFIFAIVCFAAKAISSDATYK